MYDASVCVAVSAKFSLVDFSSDVCIIKLYQVQVGGVYDDLRISSLRSR